MHLLDRPQQYGAISRLNHWLGAALVIGLLALGLYFEDMPRGEEKLFWLKLHVSIGALILPWLLFRIGWRVAATSPQPLPQSAMLSGLTRLGHRTLLLLILVLLVTGPLIVWSGGREIELFGLLSIPGPLGRWDALHEGLEVVHGLSSRILIILTIGHVLAALKHHFIDRDSTLTRMAGRG